MCLNKQISPLIICQYPVCLLLLFSSSQWQKLKPVNSGFIVFLSLINAMGVPLKCKFEMWRTKGYKWKYWSSSKLCWSTIPICEDSFSLAALLYVGCWRGISLSRVDIIYLQSALQHQLLFLSASILCPPCSLYDGAGLFFFFFLPGSGTGSWTLTKRGCAPAAERMCNLTETYRRLCSQKWGLNTCTYRTYCPREGTRRRNRWDQNGRE